MASKRLQTRSRSTSLSLFSCDVFSLVSNHSHGSKIVLVKHKHNTLTKRQWALFGYLMTTGNIFIVIPSPLLYVHRISFRRGQSYRKNAQNRSIIWKILSFTRKSFRKEDTLAYRKRTVSAFFFLSL